VLAAVMVAVAVVAHTIVLVRLRAAERRAPWWLGYARDGGTLGAALMFWGAYVADGLSAPAGLLLGMLTALAMYLAEWVIAGVLEAARPSLWLIAFGAGWAIVVGSAPGLVARGAEGLLAFGMVGP
jgi:hypothetical protein